MTANETTIEIRCKTLSKISGLTVGAYTRNSRIPYFQFQAAGKTIKTVCTYLKAKVFAEGFAAGAKHVLHKRTNLTKSRR